MCDGRLVTNIEKARLSEPGRTQYSNIPILSDMNEARTHLDPNT